MPDTSETNSVDRKIYYGNNKCWVCGEPNVNGIGGMRLCVEHKAMDPAKPWEDANAEIERLQKVVADQALTIGTLKDELGKSRAENVKLQAKVGRLIAENESTRNLLDDERSLMAATAAHTTALERRVAWYGGREPLITAALDRCLRVWDAGYESVAVKELEAWEEANPKPGTAT